LQKVRFRSLNPQDAPELAYLELQIFRSPWSENSLRDCLDLATVEGEAAVIDGRIVAYLIVQSVQDEAHILNEPFRGQGISRKLLTRFLDSAYKRKIRVFYLEVRANNRVAQNLYFSLGFAPVGARKRYYPDGEDALILMKEL
jgi:ribosomal-protein-alanine N-acetyltransferase